MALNTTIVRGAWGTASRVPFGLVNVPKVQIDYPDSGDVEDITQPKSNPPADPVVTLLKGVSDQTAAAIAADANYTVLFSYP